MKLLIWAAALAILSCQPSHAADSVFSKDATHVYLWRSPDSPGLVDIDLEKKTCRYIDLKNAITDPVNSLTVSNTGFILCATNKAIWAYDPSTSKCTKACDSAEEIDEIAYDPNSGAILVSTRGGLYILPKNSSDLQNIWNRRAPAPASMVFGDKGMLFFTGDGDLWKATITRDKDLDATRYGTLTGSRCAPLAILETAGYNASSTGVGKIAVSKGKLYLDFSRLGGTGWGALIRIQQPAAPETQAHKSDIPYDASYWAEAGAIFNSVETLCDKATWHLCSSRDGQWVFYTTRESIGESKIYVIHNDAKPEAVEIPGLSKLLGSE